MSNKFFQLFLIYITEIQIKIQRFFFNINNAGEW